MKTLGKTFLDNFQSQATPQTTPQAAPAPTTPLSNKTGLNKTKTTALTQGVLQTLAQPQMGAMQNGNS